MSKPRTRLLYELERQYELSGVSLQSAFLYAFGLGELMTGHFGPGKMPGDEIPFNDPEGGLPAGDAPASATGAGGRSLADLFGLDYLDVERLAGTGYSFSDLAPEMGPDGGPYDFVSLHSLLAESSDLEELLDCTIFQRSPTIEASFLAAPSYDLLASQEHVVVQVSSLNNVDDFEGGNLLHQLILTQSS